MEKTADLPFAILAIVVLLILMESFPKIGSLILLLIVVGLLAKL